MTTSVMTLTEYAAMLQNLADDWDDEHEPAVLIGDVAGSVNVDAKDGHSKYGPVAYAQECFDGNGVFELGQKGDRRFFGTMLFDVDDLGEEAQKNLREQDWEPAAAGGDD